MTFQKIVDDISAHADKSSFEYSQWYVGITSDIESRLHGDHKVPKENHWLITRTADSSDSARDVEEHFLDLGMDGGTGGGDSSSKYVYAYLKTSITDP